MLIQNITTPIFSRVAVVCCCLLISISLHAQHIDSLLSSQPPATAAMFVFAGEVVTQCYNKQ